MILLATHYIVASRRSPITSRQRLKSLCVSPPEVKEATTQLATESKYITGKS